MNTDDGDGINVDDNDGSVLNRTQDSQPGIFIRHRIENPNDRISMTARFASMTMPSYALLLVPILGLINAYMKETSGQRREVKISPCDVRI